MTKHTSILFAVLVLAAILTGCSVRTAPAPSAQIAAVAPSPTPSQPEKVRHVCGAKTKTGAACRKPVKNEGDRCFMHKGQPALEGVKISLSSVDAEYVRVVSAIARTMRCSTVEEHNAGRDHECDPSEIEQDAGLVDAEGQILR